jgi:hypothetical protein
MEAFGDRWPRWRQRTSTAAHHGMLCFGPDRARKVTYTNPHRWLPGFFGPAQGGQALRTLGHGYLYAYGPATPAHFARWLGIPPRFAAGLFGQLAGELERVDVDGEPGWTLAGDTATPAQPHRGIRLLPYFDAYVVAGQPRNGCTRAPRLPAHSPRQARPGTTRSCSSTAWWAEYGTSSARAASSPSPWNRCAN